MDGIGELARIHGLSEYDLRSKLYRLLASNEFARLGEMNSRQIRTRLKHIFNDQRLSFLGLNGLSGNNETTPLEGENHNLNLVA